MKHLCLLILYPGSFLAFLLLGKILGLFCFFLSIGAWLPNMVRYFPDKTALLSWNNSLPEFKVTVGKLSDRASYLCSKVMFL